MATEVRVHPTCSLLKSCGNANDNGYEWKKATVVVIKESIRQVNLDQHAKKSKNAQNEKSYYLETLQVFGSQKVVLFKHIFFFKNYFRLWFFLFFCFFVLKGNLVLALK